MVLQQRLRRAIVTSATLICIFSTGFFTPVLAQKDSSANKKVLLAAAHVKKESVYIIKEANVIYPDILKGNETFATDYVADFSSKRRNYLLGIYAKGKKIMPKVNTILKQYNLPEELGVLMLLESACNPNAVSKAGAVGYWQIMDVVAKEYGLKYVEKMSAEEKKKLLKKDAKKANLLFKTMAKQKDERKNFNKSTAAAARYLCDRRTNLDNNWLLVVASYNCGVGNVWNAMGKTGKANPDFWDIKKYLPAETQAYVMNFIALNVIFKNYDNFVSNNLNFTPLKITLPANGADVNMTEELSEESGNSY